MSSPRALMFQPSREEQYGLKIIQGHSTTVKYIFEGVKIA